MRRTVYQPEHEQFREVVREFLAREVAPHAQAWEKAGIVDRHVYQSAGKHGVIGFNVPEEFGGGGVNDFRFNAVVAEELAKAGPGTPAFTLHTDIVASEPGPGHSPAAARIDISRKPKIWLTLCDCKRFPRPAAAVLSRTGACGT